MTKKNLISIPIKFSLALLVGAVFILSTFIQESFAKEAKNEVPGRIYNFGKDSQYEFSETKDFSPTDKANTYGSFFLSGKIADVTTKDGIPAYEVNDGNLEFFYNYGDELLNAEEDSWHLTNDKGKKIDDLKLDEKILKGAIILQTSTDGLNWVNVASMTDAFNKTPIRTKPIYESKDVELINGCYYRLIVAYELRIKTEDRKVLFINRDKYDYKKCAEIYEFYAYTNDDSKNSADSKENYKLGSKVRVADFDTYSGEKAIGKSDPHYGWDLGSFFVSGYTDKIKKPDGNMVFLKNLGDKVTLSFHLNQDINNLNGKDKLSITADREGSDQYFETPTMDFGRGTLIIRHTDYKNEESEPTIYTNYLESNTSLGADTIVKLFEEGDYEVALDYQVTNNQLIDKTAHYRIFFKFSVRNGNCMVYPFDLVTGSELANTSITENGFYLDLAKSRYLKINLKRETLAEGADGLVEDTRFNGPARDGAKYTEEGIYTITVSNEYTGQSTVKKLYVGNNNVMKAHMTTGLGIAEINKLVDQGASISDDGNIQMANVEQTVSETEETKQTGTEVENDNEKAKEGEEEGKRALSKPGLIGLGLCLIILISVFVFKKRRKKLINKKKDQGERK